MISVSESIMSLALLVAASIAVMRAACSAATDSSKRTKNLNADVLRQNSLEIAAGAAARKCNPPGGSEFGSGFIDDAGVGRPDTPTPAVFAASSRCLRSSSVGFFGHLNVDFADLLDGQQALGYQSLRYHRFEFVEENDRRRRSSSASVARDHALARDWTAKLYSTLPRTPTCSPMI